MASGPWRPVQPSSRQLPFLVSVVRSAIHWPLFLCYLMLAIVMAPLCSAAPMSDAWIGRPLAQVRSGPMSMTSSVLSERIRVPLDQQVQDREWPFGDLVTSPYVSIASFESSLAGHWRWVIVSLLSCPTSARGSLARATVIFSRETLVQSVMRVDFLHFSVLGHSALAVGAQPWCPGIDDRIRVGLNTLVRPCPSRK